MTRPYKLPKFATDPVLTAGDEAGSSTRLQPSDALLAQGFYAGRLMPARMFAWLLGTIGDWLGYLDQRSLNIQALNWPERASIANSSGVNTSVPLAYDSSPTSSQGLFGSNPIIMCATADTKSITSDDGTIWRNAVSFGGTLGAAAHDLAAGNSGGSRSFLASGEGNASIIRTTNAGTTWTLSATGVATNAVLCNGSGTVWVAAGNTGVIKRSSDGLTFASVGAGVPAGWIFNAKRVVWSGTLFVVLPSSSSNKVLVSPDGSNWTLQTLPATTFWSGLAYSATEGLWMAVSQLGDVATSSDGLTWTAAATGVTQMLDLAVVGSVWVGAALNNGGGIACSVDRGVTWRNILVGDLRTADHWDRVIAVDGRFLVAHATGTAIEFALSLRAT